MSNNQKLNFQINEIRNKNDIMCIRDYKIIKRIGFGASGLVYKVAKKNDPTNKIYILKQIPYSEPNLEETTKKVQSAQNEALILSKLSCKFIVKYYNSFIDCDNNLNIIMEYCDSGDLNSFICNLKKENTYLTEEEIWHFFIQISLGLAYIHSKNILHRDLKPMNIFLTNKNQIKIGDLGVAKLLNTNANASTCIGTPYYLSPEICKEKPYNSKGDVWALGCILYELCTFNKPFSASNPAALILKIINGKYTPLNEIKNGRKYSKELQDMIDNILQKDYLIRPLMKDIINSRIFKEKAILFGFGKDLEEIQNLYEKNINKEEEFGNENKSDNNLNEKDNNNHENFENQGIKIIYQKNEFYSKNNNNSNNNKCSNNIPVIHSIKAKQNYLSTGRSTNDSSDNYDKNNNININTNYNFNKFDSQSIFNKQNDNLTSYNNKIKMDLIMRPRTKYIKYINKKSENNNSSGKKQKNSKIINDIKNLNFKDTNNIELKTNKNKTRLKMVQISPSHFRDSSGGRYNQKNISIINKLNYLGSITSKNKVNNSKEKKYINKTKNIIYNNLHNSKNKNKNYINIIQSRKKIENYKNNNYIQNKLINNNIKIGNINNLKIKEENINEKNNNNVILKKLIRNQYNASENNFHNSKEKQNEKNKINQNYINFYDKYNLNNLNNINNNYSLNFIGKTRINFYNKNFSNFQEPLDIMKMHTQNNFNNLSNYRIENGIESINNNDNNSYKKNESKYNEREVKNINKNLNRSQDSSEEHDDNNIDDEIIEDSGLEDEDDEEKVSIVKEKNNNLKENINKQKEEYLKKYKEYSQKYNEYKNQILQYKNIIDIHKLFSLYEKMSKNKTKLDDNTNEIEDFMKNCLNKDIYPKFHKLFNYYIYYDIKIQNLNSLERRYT